METMNKENEKKADARTTNQTSVQAEKKPKSYKWVAIALGLILVFVLMSECGRCSRNSAARWGTYNGIERQIISSVDEAIEDAMTKKETIDGIKVDETRTHDMDSIGLYRKGKKWGFYNLNTEKALDGGQIRDTPAYDEVGSFSEGLAAVARDGKIGFVDTKGEVVIPFQYLCRTNKVSSIAFHNGYCKMSGRDGRCGVIDKNGRWVIAPIYEGLSLTESCVYAKTSTSRIQLGYHGEVMQKDMIVKVKPLICANDSTGYYVYYVSEGGGNNRCGLMDATGHRLTEPVYSQVEALGQRLFGCYLLDGITMEVKHF